MPGLDVLPRWRPRRRQAVKQRVKQVSDWLNLGFKLGGVTSPSARYSARCCCSRCSCSSRRWPKRLLHGTRSAMRRSTSPRVYTVERLLHYLLLTIGVLWALSVAGIPMAKMTVFAGALGVGLGFGLQAIFNNFVSGLILLFERSLKVGDFVELASGRAWPRARDPHPRHPDHHQRRHRHPGAELRVRDRAGRQLDPARSGAAAEDPVRRGLRHRQGTGEEGRAGGGGGGAVHARAWRARARPRCG